MKPIEIIDYTGKLIKAESNGGWTRISGRCTSDDGDRMTVVDEITTYYIRRSTFTNIHEINEKGVKIDG